MAKRKEVADLAGVSEATVSRVFNELGPVREETKRRVKEAAQQLNYHPNAIASNLARRRSGNLGVILPYVPKVHLFSNYYFSEILSGIGDKAQEYGYDLLVKFRRPEDMSCYETMFRSQKIDACVILGARNSDRDACRRLSDGQHPFCLVNQHFPGEGFAEVDADHTEGSRAAVVHLLQQGHRHIALLNGPLEYSNSQDRLNGYITALREAALEQDSELLFTGNYSRTSGYEAADLIYRQRHKLNAIFAANDRMAIGAMQGLRERGMIPGRDYAITGCDNSDSSRLTDPPLTTIEVPFFEMGALAAETILNAMAQGKLPEAICTKLPVRLIVRESSRNRGG